MPNHIPKIHERYQESRIQGSQTFPCAYYRAVSDDFPKEYPSRTADPDSFYVPYHWHDFLEIIHVEEGEFRIDLDMEEYRVTEETFLFVTPGTIHSLQSQGRYRESAVVFHLSLLNSEHPDAMTAQLLQPLQTGRLRLPLRITGADGDLFTQLCGEYHRLEQIFLLANVCTGDQYHAESPSSQLRVKACLLNILAVLSESNSLTTDCAAESRRSQDMKAVLEYMEEHFPEKIYLADLARAASMNEQYFCRCFRRTFGQTPIEYLNQLRLRKAAKLLLETDRSVTAIALDCGFHNLGHFQAQFRALTGKAPLQFRRAASGRQS